MSWKMDWDMCRYVKTQDGMLEQSEVHDISFCSVTAAVKKRTWLFGTLTEHWALNPHHWTCFASTRIVVTGSVVLCPVTRSPPFRLVSCCDVVSRTIHGANYRTGIQGVKYCERVESEAETTEMFLFHVEFYCFLCSRFLRYISALFDSWNSDRRFGMFDMDIFTFARWRKKVTVQDVHVLMWENVKYMMCLICGKSIVHVIYMWWIIQNHITGDMFFVDVLICGRSLTSRQDISTWSVPWKLTKWRAAGWSWNWMWHEVLFTHVFRDMFHMISYDFICFPYDFKWIWIWT